MVPPTRRTPQNPSHSSATQSKHHCFPSVDIIPRPKPSTESQKCLLLSCRLSFHRVIFSGPSFISLTLTLPNLPNPPQVTVTALGTATCSLTFHHQFDSLQLFLPTPQQTTAYTDSSPPSRISNQTHYNSKSSRVLSASPGYYVTANKETILSRCLASDSSNLL